MTGNLTTARRTSPRRCGRGEDRGERTLWLRELIGKPVVGPEEQHLGHVDDVAARRTDDPQGPVVTGLVTDVGGLRLFAPASAVRRWHDEQVLVDAAGLQKLRDKDNDDRILLGSIIGKPVVTRSGDVTQVGDIGLRPRPDGWVAGVCTRASSRQSASLTKSSPCGRGSVARCRCWRATRCARSSPWPRCSC